MEQFFLAGMEVNELLEKIGKLIDSKISKSSIPENASEKAKYISRSEVAFLLKVSLPTLGQYTRFGWLKSYKIGRRVLYKENEIENSLNSLSNLKYKKGGNYGK